MKIIDTSVTMPHQLTPWERSQVYNGLDCCITHEVFQVIEQQLDPITSATYDFSRELQGPVLEMRLRGVAIDFERRDQVIEDYHEQLEILESQLERLVYEGVGLPNFNWKSNKDLQYLLYDKLQLPEIKRSGRRTVDRPTLEKLENYLIARPIISHILTMRDIGKKLGVLLTEIDPDGRMRTSYNIAGTNTGRFSSSYSEFGTGGNLQNIEESLRSVFVADERMKFAKFDAKSGESFVVGAIEWNLFKDDRYLNACESGDPHTATARICWPDLGWTGDLKKDKDIAEKPYYRHYSYRFMCKKLGHGSNYVGTPETLAAQTKLPLPVVKDFQPKYFGAYPAHLRWHAWVQNEIWTKGTLISLTGRKRQFWKRRDAPETLREAVAYDPQGSLAEIVNRAMLNIWKKRFVIISMQDHDAITFMYPEHLEDEIIPLIQSNLIVTIPLKHGRELRIPYDCKVGWNRGEYDAEKNPDGLRDYKPGDGQRRRQAKVPILDRKVRR